MKSKTTNSSKGRAQDRSKVAGGQDYEIGYESKKLNVGADKIKKTVKAVGNSRKKVEKAVKGK